MEIYIEPIMQKKKLFIFGAGHIGKAIATIASKMDFEIFVIDERTKEIDNLNLEGIDKLPVNHNKIIPNLPFDESSFILIVTHDHDIDREILGLCLKKPFSYLGMIGSKRKIEITRKMFISSKTATKKELDKVDMPMGIDIKAQGPYEIAISIIAKLIEVKNKNL